MEQQIESLIKRYAEKYNRCIAAKIKEPHAWMLNEGYKEAYKEILADLIILKVLCKDQQKIAHDSLVEIHDLQIKMEENFDKHVLRHEKFKKNYI